MSTQDIICKKKKIFPVRVTPKLMHKFESLKKCFKMLKNAFLHFEDCTVFDLERLTFPKTDNSVV